MLFGITFCLLLTGVVLSLYLFSFILRILGGTFLFGAVADFVDSQRHYKHFE